MKRLLIIIAIFAFLLAGPPGPAAVCAQEVEAAIKILSSAPGRERVRVEGKILKPQVFPAPKDWSFLRSYAGAEDLGVRVENLKLYGEGGEPLAVKKLIDGEFQAERPAFSFEYEVKTGAPGRPGAAAHVSWLTAENGLLMLNDLLPQWNIAGAARRAISGRITVETPVGWKITSGEARQGGAETFAVKDVERAIFLIGKHWREASAKVDKTELNFALAGAWQFSDDEALEMASSILAEHRRTFGDIPVSRMQVFLLPFPQKSVPPDRWQAETRGANVTILSGVIPLKSQALQRLHEQLRHELFHLWLPNAVALGGNYDWFYEGFGVYQALRAGVELNQIRFEDFLGTLAQAYDIAARDGGAGSLVDFSKRRWTGGTATAGSIYASGMVAAFLCDVALLRASRGKRSVADLLRQVYQKHRAAPASGATSPQDGTAAVLAVLKSHPELVPVVEKYVEGAAPGLDWRNELDALGIEVVSGSPTRLQVAAKPSGRQKDLLDKLGYNQWRKLLQKKK